MPNLMVRRYSQADRAAVHRIAADTAFFGQPVEAFVEDRQLFCDLFFRYYTDWEPEHGWVSCVDEEVVGFLMGCVDSVKYRRWSRRILPKVAWRMVRGDYRIGPRTQRYLRASIRAWLGRENPPVDLTAYPAHLHVNVDARWRGHGGGRRLLEAYLEQLRQLRVPGVHLYTTSLNEAACRLYVRTGFRLVAARRTHFWDGWVDQPVENRCYGLRLREQNGT